MWELDYPTLPTLEYLPLIYNLVRLIACSRDWTKEADDWLICDGEPGNGFVKLEDS